MEARAASAGERVSARRTKPPGVTPLAGLFSYRCESLLGPSRCSATQWLLTDPRLASPSLRCRDRPRTSATTARPAPMVIR